MKDFFKSKKILIPVLIVLVTIVTLLRVSYSVPLDNDVEVEPDSLLTYYLNVTYDGVDRNGVKSNDTTVASINSGYMYVSDKIPDGLIFQGFVTTSDGSIGAVRRSDENTSCLGKVVDDTNEESVDTGIWNNDNTEYTYHGLHYNANNRTVTFKVKNLQAGCKLTVGIITKTPATIDDPSTTVVENRRDFYNFGQIREDSLTVISNTVHAFMGRSGSLYGVIYQYTGNVPSNAPSVPGTATYASGSTVGVALPVDVEGYTFSGWSTSDVTINDGSFTMPSSNVTLTGSFTELPKYNVTYQINGTSPEGYVLPTSKSYYPESTVKVDSLSQGDIINGYRFSGWITTDVSVSNDKDFIMPSSNVRLVGEFSEVTYTVSYAFYDTVLPPNSNSLLPPTVSYKPGTTVSLANVTEPSGYKFLGWYKENNFVMPEENVTIYGEWMVQTGTFEPTIVKTVTSTKEYYKTGDIVTFKITVTNTANFPIHDVIVKENTENSKFVEGTGYTIETDHIAKINNIAANSSVDLFASYTVLDTDIDEVSNEAEIIGALADNNYILADKEYKAVAEFIVQSNLVVHHYVEGTETKVHDDELSEVVYGSQYSTNYKDPAELYDEYKNDYEYNNNHTGSPVNGIVRNKNIEVTYFYDLKPSEVIVHYYVDGTTDSLCADVTLSKRYRDSYESHTCAEINNNYRFKEVVSTDNNSTINNMDVTGTVKQNRIIITYYYELKPAQVITHHKEVNTNKTLADDAIINTNYGKRYTTSASQDIPSNYEFSSRTTNFEGYVDQDTIEVTYYYRVKDSKLSTSINKTGTKMILSRDDSTTYNISYNATVSDYIGDGTITIIDYLPYKIDEASSNLADGVYNANDKTITWTVDWTDINETNNSKEFNKEFTVKYLDYPSSGVINNRVVGKVRLSNNSQDAEGTISTNILLPGKIIVHHYIVDTDKKLTDDIETTDLVGQTYISNAIDFEGYRVVVKPGVETFRYTEEVQEVTYYYERIKFDIVTEVVGGVGNITGDEIVYYGDDSTEGRIVITPSTGYEIVRILVNDQDVEFSDPTGLTLDNFKNLKENIKVQVEFAEKKAEVPRTSSNSTYYIVGLILLIATIAFLYVRNIRRKFN